MRHWGRTTGSTRSIFPKGDVLIAPEGAGSVVLHVPSGTYLRLDRSATEIFQLVQEVGVDAAAIRLVERYGIDHATAESDIASIVSAVRRAESTPQSKARRPQLRGGLRVAREWLWLSAKAKFTVALVGMATVAVEIALRVLSISAISRLVGAPLRDPEGDEVELPEAEVQQFSAHEQLWLAGVEWTLARWVYDGTCLRRALLSGIALRARQPSLRIGLIENDDVLAHAWLRCDSFTIGSQPGTVRTFSQSP